jgi:predicted NAD/FAD-binding protein
MLPNSTGDTGAAHPGRLDIAVIGSGITGLSCAWLLSTRHRVTLYEAAPRLGGHSCTVDVPVPGGTLPVDMGFIVYNEPTYPNLTALFRHFAVPTQPSCMSFAVSLDDGGLEYGGHSLASLFAQRRNLLRPRFWSMLRHLIRLYRLAPGGAASAEGRTLGEWFDLHRVSHGLQRDHLLPMAAAIWSCPAGMVRDQPASAFLRFCDNHGLLRLTNRPDWRTVSGGARAYVSRLTAALPPSLKGGIEANRPVRAVQRHPTHVDVLDATGETRRFDHVVLATHGDEALALLANPDAAERRVLGAFHCSPNRAVLHADPSFMPRRRAAWASWNFLAATGAAAAAPCVTYWMNRLQSLPGQDLFVTLNPAREPAGIIAEQNFTHPIFDAATLRAQADIWTLQGANRTWFGGAWLGAGFHEDGLQAGLAIAEGLGGVRRPWDVPGESARLYLPTPWIPVTPRQHAASGLPEEATAAAPG